MFTLKGFGGMSDKPQRIAIISGFQTPAEFLRLNLARGWQYASANLPSKGFIAGAVVATAVCVAPFVLPKVVPLASQVCQMVGNGIKVVVGGVFRVVRGVYYFAVNMTVVFCWVTFLTAVGVHAYREGYVDDTVNFIERVGSPLRLFRLFGRVVAYVFVRCTELDRARRR